MLTRIRRYIWDRGTWGPGFHHDTTHSFQGAILTLSLLRVTSIDLLWTHGVAPLALASLLEWIQAQKYPPQNGREWWGILSDILSYCWPVWILWHPAIGFPALAVYLVAIGFYTAPAE